ncbi:unnamed protein product [Strongylus vulgaris]|uniref:G-protein coupled receptors family 1 profile domain-containing protein n=1 Tax=Strongylus vulgaris TaxID=40348 RepID=A0A3P7KJN0_STRVU|nr:unnamed protein product [Strongylus vulgaris]
MSLIARIFMVLYIIDILHTEGDIRSNPGLVAASFVTAWGRCSSVSVFVAVLLERYYASHFIIDYETKARKWVALLVLTLSSVITAIFVIPMIFGLLTVYALSVVALILYTICPSVYILLYQRDKRQVLLLTAPQCTHYLLSARFQLAENLRVMKIIMYTSIVYSIWLIAPCSLVLLSYVYFSPRSAEGQICYAAYDLLMATSILALLLYTLLKTGTFPINICIRPLRPQKHDIDKHGDDKTSEMYFRQLATAWEL